jgi:D-lyxose ketol-isomerase
MEHNQRESMKFLQKLLVPTHYHRLALKSWGFEYWFENNKQYCGKIIQVRGTEWSSFGAFHYHKIKDETFLVLSGTLMLDIVDLDGVIKGYIPHNKICGLQRSTQYPPTVHRFYLKPFDYMRLRPGVLHRFSALGFEAMFTETSTTHKEEDSYRISNPEAHEQMDFPIKHKHGLSEREINTEKYSYLKNIREG